jgi:hypothetical protein
VTVCPDVRHSEALAGTRHSGAQPALKLSTQIYNTRVNDVIRRCNVERKALPLAADQDRWFADCVPESDLIEDVGVPGRRISDQNIACSEALCEHVDDKAVVFDLIDTFDYITDLLGDLANSERNRLAVLLGDGSVGAARRRDL